MRSLSAFLVVVLLAGCAVTASEPVKESYPETYQRHVDEHTVLTTAGSDFDQEAMRDKFEPFLDFFAELREEGLEDRVSEIYASELYFNDTLRTFSSRDELVSYLRETARKVEFNRVKVTRIVPFGDDYFLQWSMSSGFKVFGKLIETDSIGITHVRLDDQGKVNFHQDFWDNTEGLFSHLPVVGYVVRRTRDGI